MVFHFTLSLYILKKNNTLDCKINKTNLKLNLTTKQSTNSTSPSTEHKNKTIILLKSQAQYTQITPLYIQLNKFNRQK